MLHKLTLLAVALAAVLASMPQPGEAQAPSPVPGSQERSTGREWKASWIWTEGEPAPRNSYTYFRKRLTLDRAQKEAKIHLTADSRYQLFVNGAFVGRGPVRSDRRWLYYDTWDLAPHLKKGENVVAVLVHHFGESTFQYMQGRGGLLAEVVGQGGRPLAGTDETWRALRSAAWSSTGPRMSIQLGFNEAYDARQAPEGWTAADFNDSSWAAVKEIGPAGMEPWPSLTPRDIPAMLETPMRARKVLETVELEPPAPAQHVDLLAQMPVKEWAVAYLAATLKSPDERRVTLHFGSDDALKVWLNGRLIASHAGDRAAAPDQHNVPVTLRAGENRLLAKVVQGHSKWEFFFRASGHATGVEQSAPAGGQWSVLGPFPFPMDVTLRKGYDLAFPPEQRAAEAIDPARRVAGGAGGEVAWRAAPSSSTTFPHVSQLMANSRRLPLDAGTVQNPERVIEDGPAGAQIQTPLGAGVSFLIDFGKEVTGFPRFRVRNAKGGEIIHMGYGEVLHDEKGGFLPQSTDTAGKLNPDRDGVHYADRYVCRPGNQTFQTFDKRGFRYLQLDVHNADAGLELDDVSLIFSTYPVQYRGAFNCSDERLNRIWEIGRWTCQLNMEDGYTDCPWRERGQWWGDARVEALINYYAFGDTALIKKCLRQQGQSLNEEGMTWGVYPTDWDGGRLPSFTLIWVSTLWDTYEYTADEAIVRELFPKVRYTLDRFFAPRVGPRGLLKDVPYWVFIDWAPVDDKGEMGSLNAYYYDALRSAARMARLLNDDSAAEYERRAGAVKTALNRELWDAAAHAYRDSLLPDGKLSPKITQQTNSLCVLFDIAPRAEHARILDYVYASENKSKVVEAGSPYFSYYQLAALYHAGRDEQALAYIRERWGKMLDWGATTWWEMWQPGASFCHGWSGGPTYNLPAEVLGIKPLKPGFSEVLVEPQWVGLRYASAVVPTAKGDVKVAWNRDEATGSAAVRVETPKEVPAEVVLPTAGEVLFNKKPVLPKTVIKLPSENGTQRYRIERGEAVLFELRNR
ncbi:MAG: family 78 glycoside hydrolase catalytic domain [Actinomycetota bacterium]